MGNKQNGFLRANVCCQFVDADGFHFARLAYFCCSLGYKIANIQRQQKDQLSLESGDFNMTFLTSLVFTNEAQNTNFYNYNIYKGKQSVDA